MKIIKSTTNSTKITITLTENEVEDIVRAYATSKLVLALPELAMVHVHSNLHNADVEVEMPYCEGRSDTLVNFTFEPIYENIQAMAQ